VRKGLRVRRKRVLAAFFAVAMATMFSLGAQPSEAWWVSSNWAPWWDNGIGMGVGGVYFTNNGCDGWNNCTGHVYLEFQPGGDPNWYYGPTYNGGENWTGGPNEGWYYGSVCWGGGSWLRTIGEVWYHNGSNWFYSHRNQSSANWFANC